MPLSGPKNIIEIFAPAKINLYLHITDRLANGYHMLDSIIGFADIGDTIRIERADEFSFDVAGPFAGCFSGAEISADRDSKNLVVRAAHEFAEKTGRDLKCRITLVKNLPLEAGLGGGSADAAATLWGLALLWGMSPKLMNSPALAISLATFLGADVPVCLPCRPARILGVGDIVSAAPSMPEVPIVLVHPGKGCSTAEIFSDFDSDCNNSYHEEIRKMPESFNTFDNMISFLNEQHNDLTASALKHVPEIEAMLKTLGNQHDCTLARMTGSGSCCFGLFSSDYAAAKAFSALSQNFPDWWVASGILNRPARY